LFLTLLLSMAVVAGAGLALVRWSLQGGGSAPLINEERARLLRTAGTLADAYRARAGWSFLPADADARRRSIAALPTPAVDPASTWSARLVLLDDAGRVLAGTPVHPLLVALASIDRVRQDVRVDGHRVGALVLAMPRDADDALVVAFLISRQRELAWLAAICLLLSASAAALVALGFRRPIAALARAAQALGDTHFDARVADHRSDELGELARSFNRLAERLQQAEQARRHWVADTSHELRTPLAVMGAQLEALEDGVRPLTPHSLALLRRHLHGLTRLVDDLDALAQSDVGTLSVAPQSLDAWALAVEVWAGFAERWHDAGLSAALGQAPARSRVLADALRLRQVLFNLLSNSARYTTAGGRVLLSATVVDATLNLSLDDSAPGVDAAVLGRLGERFFRVEPSRSRLHGGSGLGLALSRRLLAAQGGHITFAASALGGLRVTVSLPLQS